MRGNSVQKSGLELHTHAQCAYVIGLGLGGPMLYAESCCF